MSKLKIASVSYLNSVPFNYGISNSQLIDAELILANPAECSRLLGSGEVDMALISVASLPSLRAENGVEVVTSHCIGASTAVRSVVLMSDERPCDIKRIWLDPESQTSVRLMAYLSREHFRITPQWMPLKSMDRVQHPQDGDAFVLIGDKVFEHEGEFEYTIDLAEAWIEHTNLPFTFAAWCAREGASEESIEQLEEALTWGVEHTYEAMVALRPDIEIEDGYRYLTQNIDTLFDGAKREGMAKFLTSDLHIDLTSNEESVNQRELD
ncbi:MAG: menaquinone biosynthesis protein [Rikenellaceae bacterium]